MSGISRAFSFGFGAVAEVKASGRCTTSTGLIQVHRYFGEQSDWAEDFDYLLYLGR